MYMQVSRGNLVLHLTQCYGDCCPGSNAFVEMRGIEEFHREVSSKNYKFMRPGLSTAPWNARTMEVLDPFGNRIRLNEYLTISSVTSKTQAGADPHHDIEGGPCRRTDYGGGVMRLSRRAFLEQSTLLTGAAMFGGQSSAAVLPTGVGANDDLIARMTWMNEPAAWSRSGHRLVVRSRTKTDFWRKTVYGYITDNGHFFHLPINGDFTFQAHINGDYAALYDQAGLMVRVDAENWMKCGTEFFQGQRHASVVFTRDFSDWPTMPDLSTTTPIWWRAVRKRDSIEASCSLDGKNFTSVRQGYFVPSMKANVGIMCAAPEGPGFDAIFDDLKLELG